jgi:hypothetical protein
MRRRAAAANMAAWRAPVLAKDGKENRKARELHGAKASPKHEREGMEGSRRLLATVSCTRWRWQLAAEKLAACG